MTVIEPTRQKRAYEPYLKADWGLANHWYPALFSHELANDDVKGVTIGGVPILLRRAKGVAYALRDQCLHRGVKLSLKPTCFNDSTVSCWYHGYTYDLADGELRSIVAAPDDELIGKVALQTFPVEEVNGMIFVFVGDRGYAPVPPLADDLPIHIPEDHPFRVAHPLDENAVILGIHRTGQANWRLAVENGFDPGHVLIHRDAEIVIVYDMALPLGFKPVSDKATEVIEGDGPKGIMNMYGTEHYVPVLANEELGQYARGTVIPMGLRTSMYLPGVLMVENWPKQGLVQYEWYVPVDDKRHEYWEVIVAPCNSPEEKEAFQREYINLWEPMALRGFNDADLFAREAMQPFYEDGTGWEEEQMCSLDAVIMGWRRIVSRHNRGILSPPHGTDTSSGSQE